MVLIRSRVAAGGWRRKDYFFPLGASGGIRRRCLAEVRVCVCGSGGEGFGFVVMEGGLSSRMWRRHGTGVLVVGGVCGLGWVQRERLFRAWRMVCALFRTGYYTSLMMERLSEDMYRYLYPEETGDTSTELPGSVKRVLTLLTSTQVVEAFGVLVRAGAEGVIQKVRHTMSDESDSHGIKLGLIEAM